MPARPIRVSLRAAERAGEAGDLGQAAGDQRGAGVEPEAHAVGDPGGDRHDVLDRAADFAADEVGVGVDAQARLVQHAHPVAGERGVACGERDRRGQAASDLGGEARAGEHAAGRLGPELLGDDLVRQAAGAGLEALARPQQRRPGLMRLQLADGFAQAGERGDDQVQVGLLGSSAEIALDAERVVQAHAGQIAPVLAQARDLVEVWAVSTPQAHLMGVAERLGERRAPGARAEHGNAAAAHSPQTSLACM
jgi:hypothetical protein